MNEVPIIGAPTIEDWSVNLAIKCPAPCANTLICTGKVSVQIICNKCRRVYVLGALQFSREGQLQAGIGVGHLPEKPV